jgi:hypothetical protein
MPTSVPPFRHVLAQNETMPMHQYPANRARAVLNKGQAADGNYMLTFCIRWEVHAHILHQVGLWLDRSASRLCMLRTPAYPGS